MCYFIRIFWVVEMLVNVIRIKYSVADLYVLTVTIAELIVYLNCFKCFVLGLSVIIQIEAI